MKHAKISFAALFLLKKMHKIKNGFLCFRVLKEIVKICGLHFISRKKYAIVFLCFCTLKTEAVKSIALHVSKTCQKHGCLFWQ